MKIQKPNEQTFWNNRLLVSFHSHLTRLQSFRPRAKYPSMVASLIGSLDNVGPVSATRSTVTGPGACIGAYVWTITFTNNAGDVPQLSLVSETISAAWTGVGVSMLR